MLSLIQLSTTRVLIPFISIRAHCCSLSNVVKQINQSEISRSSSSSNHISRCWLLLACALEKHVRLSLIDAFSSFPFAFGNPLETKDFNWLTTHKIPCPTDDDDDGASFSNLNFSLLSRARIAAATTAELGATNSVGS